MVVAASASSSSTTRRRSSRRGSRPIARHYLCRQAPIFLGACRLALVFEYRQAVARTFRQPDTARNDAGENLVGKVATHLARDLVREPVARIKHREHQPFDLERRPERILDP